MVFISPFEASLIRDFSFPVVHNTEILEYKNFRI